MNRDIDFFEYERRKRVLRHTFPTPREYDAGINRIVAELEADTDRAEIHEAKTTASKCPICKAPGTLEPIAGYFDPRLKDVSEDEPRKYEEGWKCAACLGRFNESELEVAA